MNSQIKKKQKNKIWIDYWTKNKIEGFLKSFYNKNNCSVKEIKTIDGKLEVKYIKKKTLLKLRSRVKNI